MKTFVTILCILLAIVLFLSSSTTARELAEITPGKVNGDGVIPEAAGKPHPNKPKHPPKPPKCPPKPPKPPKCPPKPPKPPKCPPKPPKCPPEPKCPPKTMPGCKKPPPDEN